MNRANVSWPLSKKDSRPKSGRRKEKSPKKIKEKQIEEEHRKGFLDTLNTRATRYNFEKRELGCYMDFVQMLSKFSNQTMVEMMMEDAVKDAKFIREERLKDCLLYTSDAADE